MKNTEGNEYVRLVSWTRHVHMRFMYTGGRKARKGWNCQVFQYLSGICEREKSIDICSLNSVMRVTRNSSIFIYIFIHCKGIY